MTVVIAQVEYVDYHVHIPIQTHRHVTVEKRMQRTLWGNGNNCCLLAFLGNSKVTIRCNRDKGFVVVSFNKRK